MQLCAAWLARSRARISNARTCAPHFTFFFPFGRGYYYLFTVFFVNIDYNFSPFGFPFIQQTMQRAAYRALHHFIFIPSLPFYPVVSSSKVPIFFSLDFFFFSFLNRFLMAQKKWMFDAWCKIAWYKHNTQINHIKFISFLFHFFPIFFPCYWSLKIINKMRTERIFGEKRKWSNNVRASLLAPLIYQRCFNGKKKTN